MLCLGDFNKKWHWKKDGRSNDRQDWDSFESLVRCSSKRNIWHCQSDQSDHYILRLFFLKINSTTIDHWMMPLYKYVNTCIYIYDTEIHLLNTFNVQKAWKKTKLKSSFINISFQLSFLYTYKWKWGISHHKRISCV